MKSSMAVSELEIALIELEYAAADFSQQESVRAFGALRP